MSITTIESFDIIADQTDLQSRGWYAAEGSIAATASQWFTPAWNLGTTDGNVLSRNLSAIELTPYYGVAFYVQYDSVPTMGTLVAISGAAATTTFPYYFNSHLYIGHTGGGNIEIFTGNASRATLTGVIGSGAPIHIEVRVHVANVGYYEVWINGILRDSGTDVDVLLGSLTSLTIGGGKGAVNTYIDDVVISEDATALTGLIGSHRVQTLLPSGNGTNSAWTGSSTDIDDAFGASDGDTTYITSGALNAESDFALNNITGSPTSVAAISLFSETRKTDSGTRGVTPYILSNGVQEFGTEAGTIEAYVSSNDIIALNPDGNVPWTETTINALQAGVKVTT